MLSRHVLVIAAIFVPYVLLMGGLFAYIVRTGKPQPPPGGDPDDGERERDQADMRLAALACSGDLRD